MKFATSLFFCLLFASVGNAATWYVRNGGGTITQCTGQTNADYPSSGTRQACAYNNGYDALSAATFGDMIKFHAGQEFRSAPNAPLLRFSNKGAGTDYITLTTDGTIPTQFATAWPYSYSNRNYTRITTAIAANMPKWVSVGNQAAIVFDDEAHHFKIVGIEMHDDGTKNNPALIGNGNATGVPIQPHHLIFDQNFIHPFSENGTFTRFLTGTDFSGESAFILNCTDSQFTHNAIQGWAGYSLDHGFKQNASPILAIIFNNNLVEGNLLEGNGPVFIGGGGGTDPAHLATGTNWTYTSATLSNTTDLNVGDLFRVYSDGLANNHLTPIGGNYQLNPDTFGPRIGGYCNGRITAVNHGTGAITFTHLTAGIRYYWFNLFTFGATGGSFKLTFMGSESGPIPWNYTKAQLRTALEGMASLNPNDFAIRTAADDGWPYAPTLIIIGRDESGTKRGQWQDPTPINPLKLTSNSLTGGNDPAGTFEMFNESYVPLQDSADGTISDIPLAGAAVAWKGVQAHDSIFRRNIIAHRPEWAAAGISGVKGFVETKGITNATFDANIFSGDATGFVPTVRSQGGTSPWANITGFTVTNNVWDKNANLFPFLLSDGAYQSDMSSNITISNNLVLGPGGDPSHVFVSTQSGDAVTIRHNTVFLGGRLMQGYFNAVSTNMVIKDNIFRPGNNLTAVCLDGPPPCWTGQTSGNNLLINSLGTTGKDFFNAFPDGWEEPTFTPVKFVSFDSSLGVAGNWRLAADSPYHAGNARQASDGRDVGVDFTQLIAAFNGFDPTARLPVPVVNAGADQNLSVGTTSTTLTGAATGPSRVTPTATPTPSGIINIQGFVFSLREGGVRVPGATIKVVQGGLVLKTAVADQFALFAIAGVPIGSSLVVTAPGLNFAPFLVDGTVTGNYFIYGGAVPSSSNSN